MCRPSGACPLTRLEALYFVLLCSAPVHSSARPGCGWWGRASAHSAVGPSLVGMRAVAAHCG
eukprot:8042906-Alexandrium_andersonii.AAC.1